MHLISMTNKKLTFTMLLFALLCLTIVVVKPVQADATAGVSPGGTFTYKMQGLFTTTNSSQQTPEIIKQANATDWYRVSITAVSGADVTIKTTWRFTNGTEITQDGHVNVETSIYDGDFWAIFAGNLNAGDLARPSGPGSIIVNSTVSRIYPAGNRDTNEMSLVMTYVNTNDNTQTYTRHIITDFDKQTGMLVTTWDQSVFSDSTATLIWELTDSSVWVAPEFPAFVVLPVFMLAAGLALIAIKKKWANICNTLPSKGF